MSGAATLLSLCATNEVPEGSALKVERDGLILAVFNLGNQYYVTDDACTHGPGSLSEGEIDGDIVSEFGSVQVVTDKMSAPYLMGATIDFVDTIEKQGFTIDNPNATGSCACGDSFH